MSCSAEGAVEDNESDERSASRTTTIRARAADRSVTASGGTTTRPQDHSPIRMAEIMGRTISERDRA
jgi:hypothetical protein